MTKVTCIASKADGPSQPQVPLARVHLLGRIGYTGAVPQNSVATVARRWFFRGSVTADTLRMVEAAREIWIQRVRPVMDLQLKIGWDGWRWVATWIGVAISQIAIEPVAMGWGQDPRQEKTRPTFSAAQVEFFEKSVRPILVERCQECHDPAAGEVGGGLSLMSRADILVGGESGPAIEPGDPMNSLLIEAVRHGERVQMPPGDKIPVAEIATLVEWIDQRAPWPLESDQRSTVPERFDLEERRNSHWSWQSLQAPPVPADLLMWQWPQETLDRFVLQRLEAADLPPARPAAPEVWLRRVHLDLIGLPPTAQQIRDYLASRAAILRDGDGAMVDVWSANETQQTALRQLQGKIVDDLLAAEEFGEHWARHWLDLVRYAETCGHEFDYPLPGAFEYRDYVIRALNQDVPYDQWVREHLAGDLMIEPRRHPTEGFNESILGTMFWFLGEALHAPVDVRGDQATRIDNQIDVFGKTFLGLTVACARCHDHKFDAISAADYYALAGVVAGMRRDETVIDTGQVQQKYWDQVRQHQRSVDRLMQERWEHLAIGLRDEASNESGERSAADLASVVTQYLAALPGDQVGRGPTTPEDHPLRLISAYARRPAGQPVDQWWSSFRQRILDQAAAAERFQSTAVLVTDFSPPQRQTWWSSGLAFAADSADRWRPTEVQDELTAPDPSRWVVGQPGIVDSRRQGLTLAGTLRSPTFQLASDKLHVLARGQNAKIRLVIDGYQMNLYHDLLFSQTVLPVNSANFEWRTMQGDLGKYVGHHVYLELIDEGDGFLAVDQIWQGGEQPVVAPSPLLLQLCQRQEQVDDLVQLVAMTVALLQSSETGEFDWSWQDSRTTSAVESAGGGDQIERQSGAASGRAGSAARERVRETSGRVAGPPRPARGRRTTLTAADQTYLQSWIWNWSLEQRFATTGSAMAAWETAWLRLAEQGQQISPPPVGTRKSWVAAGSEGFDHSLYIRGNPRNSGDKVPRGTLTALQNLTPAVSLDRPRDPSGRWSLAQNLTSPENPLVARVMVNRIWLHLMGEGLVTTPDDFGVMGGRPTHPELLDYLAIEFMARGWSIKQMIRQMVLSQTYAMSVDADPRAAERDPTNELWHRANVRRLSGEVLRDAMLHISGRLDPSRYGPSVPTHVTELMQGRGRPTSGPQDGAGRRSIYLEVRRNFLSPWMLVFDTPAPFSTMGKRNRSNVPAQALAMLNDPLVHDLAAAWADQVLARQATSRERLEDMFLSAFGREIQEAEWLVFEPYLAESLPPQPVGTGTIDSAPTAEQRAVWTRIAHALLNAKEFAYRH